MRLVGNSIMSVGVNVSVDAHLRPGFVSASYSRERLVENWLMQRKTLSFKCIQQIWRNKHMPGCWMICNTHIAQRISLHLCLNVVTLKPHVSKLWSRLVDLRRTVMKINFFFAKYCYSWACIYQQPAHHMYTEVVVVVIAVGSSSRFRIY